MQNAIIEIIIENARFDMNRPNHIFSRASRIAPARSFFLSEAQKAQDEGEEPRTTINMLSDAEIVRRLRAIRHDGGTERYARRATSVSSVARAAGLTRRYLYMIMQGHPVGSLARVKLSNAFACEAIDRGKTGGCLRLDGPAEAPKTAQIASKTGVFALGARCQSPID